MSIFLGSVHSSFKELVFANLIWEKRVGCGNANQIYLALVELPAADAGKHAAAPFENEGARPADSAHLVGERPATRPVEMAHLHLLK